MNIKWDAEKYTSDFAFVHQYGNSVVDLIDADKNSKVLDLGCGNGALTARLKEKGYTVTGMDASRELLDLARENYPDIEFVQADAVDFSFPEPFDVVFSNAVFHWIDQARQEDMLKCIHKALRKGGQLVFEFGGYGNNQCIHEALERAFVEYGYAYKMPFYFPSIGEYASLLERNGFRVKYAVLFDRATELKGENGLKDWINMFVKAPFAAVRTPEDKELIKDKAAALLRDHLYIGNKWYADYVRLRMKALRL